MTTAIAGQRAGNMIIPLSNMTKRTKQIPITVTGTNWTTTRAVAIFYSDSSNNWRMKFNIRGIISPTTTNITLTIANILSKNVSGLYQAITVWWGTNAIMRSVVFPNSNTISADVGTADGNLSLFGDIELDTEPLTYTTPANMEARASADIYIDHGTYLSAGVVGGSNGNGIVAGRIGSIIQATAMTDYEVPDTTFTKWNNNDNSLITLPYKGRWQVVANINVLVAIAHNSPAGARLDVNTEIVGGSSPARIANQSRLSGIALANATTSNYVMNVSVHAYNFILDNTTDNYPLWIRGRYVSSGSAVRQSTTLSNASDRNSNFYAMLIG